MSVMGGTGLDGKGYLGGAKNAAEWERCQGAAFDGEIAIVRRQFSTRVAGSCCREEGNLIPSGKLNLIKGSSRGGRRGGIDSTPTGLLLFCCDPR